MGCSGNLPRFVLSPADRDCFFFLGAFGSCIAWKTESTHVASSCLSKAAVDVSILGSDSSIPDGAVFPASAHPYSSLREGKMFQLTAVRALLRGQCQLPVHGVGRGACVDQSRTRVK